MIREGEELILVFSFAFSFLWGYLKKFPHGNKLKMVLALTVLGILVSFLISFLTLYGFYGVYDTDRIELVRSRENPVLARLSLPFYCELASPGVRHLMALYDDFMWFRMYFADVQLWEMEFLAGYRTALQEGRLYIYSPEQPNVNYTTPLFYQLLVIFTAFNMIGAPLAAFAYKLTEKFMKRISLESFNFKNAPKRLLTNYLD